MVQGSNHRAGKKVRLAVRVGVRRLPEATNPSSSGKITKKTKGTLVSRDAATPPASRRRRAPRRPPAAPRSRSHRPAYWRQDDSDAFAAPLSLAERRLPLTLSAQRAPPPFPGPAAPGGPVSGRQLPGRALVPQTPALQEQQPRGGRLARPPHGCSRAWQRDQRREMGGTLTLTPNNATATAAEADVAPPQCIIP